MQSIESTVSNFKVDAVFNRKPVKLPKKRYVRIDLVGVKHDMGQERDFELSGVFDQHGVAVVNTRCDESRVQVSSHTQCQVTDL